MQKIYNTPFQKGEGFTLIELLVVVLIIGILASLAIPQYQHAVAKARFTQLVVASKNIVDAQKEYYMSNGVYASRADELTLDYPLNADGTTFVIQGRPCHFSYANGLGGAPRTACHSNKPNVVLERLHAQNRVYCCSYASDDYAGDWLCKDATGATAPYSTNNNMHCYAGDI